MEPCVHQTWQRIVSDMTDSERIQGSPVSVKVQGLGLGYMRLCGMTCTLAGPLRLSCTVMKNVSDMTDRARIQDPWVRKPREGIGFRVSGCLGDIHPAGTPTFVRHSNESQT